jgi:3-phosphoshikimate 1-carboxyvinyltransferase
VVAVSAPEPVDISVPGDKSLSHRALILSALARGESHVRGLLDSDDVQSTAECLRVLGFPVPTLSAEFVVNSPGASAMVDATRDLDCGNSGTTARLLAGVVAGARVRARFVGDASLTRRPMARLAVPLRELGARVEFDAGTDGLPMRIGPGAAPLQSVTFDSPTPSAQLKSAVILAGLVGGVGVTAHEPTRSRDHTERMLSALGVPIAVDGTTVRLPPGAHRVAPLDFDVPGDPSSAAFFAAWAVLAGTPVRTNTIALNPTRTGFLDVLARVGAHVHTERTTPRCGEPVGRVLVSGVLAAPFTVTGADVPAMVDELPLVACLAARAPGTTRVGGAGELRVKESDRIAVVVANLRAIGADADELPDGFVVRGSERPLRGTVVTHGDHRIAMAFGVLGALPGNEVVVDDPGCVAVSFPGFWRELDRVARGAR